MTDDTAKRELIAPAKVLPFIPRQSAVIPADAWEIMKSIGRAAFGLHYPDDPPAGTRDK